MSITSSVNSDGDKAIDGSAGVEDDYTYYSPAHSAYLIHWTGQDIDTTYDKHWFKDHSSKTNSEVTQLYITRLKSILKYGLWLTDDNESITMKDNIYTRPTHCRTCFTELKLSAIRGHARSYGRLGIGFKRPFVLNRFGRPMVYFHDGRNNWFEPCMCNPAKHSYDEFFSCFLKPMNQKTPDTTMRYTFYDESEWRIIYSNEIANRLMDQGHDDVVKAFVPAKAFSPEFQQEIGGLSPQPRALIPINDRWFAMIIYPSLSVKVASESDSELRQLIHTLKPEMSMPGSYSNHNPAWLEPYSKPFEIDLDACRNF